MSEKAVFEFARKEQKAMEELLKSLQRERDAIISFSLEGMTLENNRKEGILGELEYLKGQKEKLLETLPGVDEILASSKWKSIAEETATTAREVRVALQKNGRLLSFSVDHVKSSVERILSFAADATYGRKAEPKPLLFSKVI